MVQRKWPNEDELVAAPEEKKIKIAAGKLSAEIRDLSEKLASELLGYPRRGDTENGWPQWWAASKGTEAMLHLQLTRLRICLEAGLDPTAAVVDAKAAGATWSQIATICNRTKQAVASRWGDAVEQDAERRRENAERRTRPYESVEARFNPEGKPALKSSPRSRGRAPKRRS